MEDDRSFCTRRAAAEKKLADNATCPEAAAAHLAMATAYQLQLDGLTGALDPQVTLHPALTRRYHGV